MTHRAAVSWLAFAGCVALAGCSAFAPRSDSSRFFFLTPLATAGASPGGGGEGSAGDPSASGGRPEGHGAAGGPDRVGVPGGSGGPGGPGGLGPPGAREKVAAAQGHAALAVGLAEIRFPPYLDRPELATRVAPNELIFSRVARWAEPLGPGFARVLAVDLDAQLGAASVVRSPWYSAAQLDCVLTVEVDHFEVDGSPAAAGARSASGVAGASEAAGASGSSGAGADALLVARWSIKDPFGKKVLRSGTSIHRRPLAGANPAGAGLGDAGHSAPTGGGGGAAATVSGLSQLIEDFSREMAAALRLTVAGGSPPGR